MSLYGELFDTEKAKDEESGLMAGWTACWTRGTRRRWRRGSSWGRL